jgi:hypothetical protein
MFLNTIEPDPVPVSIDPDPTKKGPYPNTAALCVKARLFRLGAKSHNTTPIGKKTNSVKQKKSFITKNLKAPFHFTVFLCFFYAHASLYLEK